MGNGIKFQSNDISMWIQNEFQTIHLRRKLNKIEKEEKNGKGKCI